MTETYRAERDFADYEVGVAELPVLQRALLAELRPRSRLEAAPPETPPRRPGQRPSGERGAAAAAAEEAEPAEQTRGSGAGGEGRSGRGRSEGDRGGHFVRSERRASFVAARSARGRSRLLSETRSVFSKGGGDRSALVRPIADLSTRTGNIWRGFHQPGRRGSSA